MGHRISPRLRLESFEGGHVDFEMVARMGMFGNNEFRRHPIAQLVGNSRRPPGVK